MVELQPSELGARFQRVSDGDGPPLAGTRVTGDDHVAAEAHHRARGAGGHQLGDHEIGRDPFADAAKVDADSGGQGDRSTHAVHKDPLAAGGRRRDRLGGAGTVSSARPERVEGPAVAGGVHRGENGGVEKPAGQPPCGDRPSEDVGGLGGHPNRGSSRSVQPR